MPGKDIAEYVDNHNIYSLFQNLLQRLVIEKPLDPVQFLQEVLGQTINLQIAIIGPASSIKKKFVCSYIKII
jgi:hypothetical protein